MKALVFEGPMTMPLRDVPEPSPQEDELLVNV